MKAFYAILLLVFLASCGTPVVPQEPVDPVNPEEQLQQEVSAEIDAEAEKIIEELIKIWEESEDSENEEEKDSSDEWQDSYQEIQEVEESKQDVPAEATQPIEDTASTDAAVTSKVTQLTASYTNPAGNVDMNISYSTDSDWNITEISVTSPNYKWMVGFNKNVQAVIGMSVDEASEYYVSGSSLTTPAFQKALKNG